MRRKASKRMIAAGLLAAALPAGRLEAAPAYSCGGFALLGGAQLVCSHLDPGGPAQICSYSWALTTMTGAPSIAQGSFVLPPGAANAQEFQGGGYAGQLANPIVLCQARRSR